MREAGLPYRCDECQFQTALESYLAGHMRVFHPPEVRRVRAPSRSKIPQILHNPQKLGKSKITKEDTEGSGGEVTEDKSPFVRLISEALAQAEGKALSTDDICEFISRRSPKYEMNMIGWQISVKLRLNRNPKFVRIHGGGGGGGGRLESWMFAGR